MLALKCALVIIYWLLVPLLVGVALEVIFSVKESVNGLVWRYSQTYLHGLVPMMALFEVICVPAIFMKQSLHVVNIIFHVGILVIWGLACALVLCKKREMDFSKISIYNFGDGIHKISTKERLAKVVLWIIFVGTILFLFFHHHYDADDATYVTTATSAYETDTLLKYHAYTGEEADLSAFSDRIVSPYSLVFAALAQLTGLHPAIIMHSLMPVISLMWFWMVCIIIGHEIFKNKREYYQFVLVAQIVLLFGSYSTRSLPAYSLLRSWQGKAMLVAIGIPLMYLSWMQIRKEMEHQMIFGWVSFFSTILFCWLMSSNMLMFGPILMIMCGTDVIVNQLGKGRLIKVLCGLGLNVILMLPSLLL